MKLNKILILIITAFLLTGCSNKNKTIPDNKYKLHEQILTPSPAPTSSATEPYEHIVDIVDNDPVILNINSDGYTYNYFNYINHMPIIKISEYLYEFSYDGTITLTDTSSGICNSFHITEKVDTMHYLNENANKDNWYYMGYILADDYIFLRYDYIGTTQYSMLLRMDLSGNNIIICTVNPYYEKESLNNFVIFNEKIYYTSISEQNNNIITSIIKTDLSGDNEQVIYSFEEGIQVEYVFPYENSLYMICTALDGKKSLQKYDLSSQERSIILYEYISDFLYIYDGYILLSIYNDTHLCYYSLDNKKYYYINLTSGDQTYFSSPFMSEGRLYVAVFSWDEFSETKLARLDLKNKSIDKYILLSRQFYRSLGIINNILFVEDSELYKAFDIDTGLEISLYYIE